VNEIQTLPNRCQGPFGPLRRLAHRRQYQLRLPVRFWRRRRGKFV
jgi:hypothetical protein